MHPNYINKGEDMTDLQRLLFSLSDSGYACFQQKLIPTVNPKRIIGVRVPTLRKIAKSLDQDAANKFLAENAHYYLEENFVHAFLIEKCRSFGDCINMCNAFLPFVDNWAVCDSLNPKVFAKEKTALEKDIIKWLESEHEFTVRFGIKMLMTYYLGDDFNPKYAEMVINACNDDYYISMMTAWYFATALAKNYDECVGYVEDRRLDIVTHNRTIQKAVESYRISDERKHYLKTLRIKSVVLVD